MICVLLEQISQLELSFYNNAPVWCVRFKSLRYLNYADLRPCGREARLIGCHDCDLLCGHLAAAKFRACNSSRVDKSCRNKLLVTNHRLSRGLKSLSRFKSAIKYDLQSGLFLVFICCRSNGDAVLFLSLYSNLIFLSACENPCTTRRMARPSHRAMQSFSGILFFLNLWSQRHVILRISAYWTLCLTRVTL